jgi:hypothetical protein
MSANVNGTMTYYVVLGHWATSAEAQENANLFKANGMIGESRIVSFPKHQPRPHDMTRPATQHASRAFVVRVPCPRWRATRVTCGPAREP